jgi:hypothetical protein
MCEMRTILLMRGWTDLSQSLSFAQKAVNFDDAVGKRKMSTVLASKKTRSSAYHWSMRPGGTMMA